MFSKSRLRWERLVTLSERSASAISVKRKEWSFAVPKGPKGEKRPADVVGVRRFTRLTNAHSKKFENHCHMVALYTVWYNFVRTNSAVRMPPAMAAGIAKSPWGMANIVKLIDAAAPKPGRRGSYKKRNSN